MSIGIPSGGSATAGAFMDSALLHGAVAAFYRSHAQMSQWERYSLAMMTLGLWFHRGLRIQAGTYEGTSTFDCALRELGAVRAQPAMSEDYDECLRKTNEWATGNVADVRQSVGRMQTDPSYDSWIDWSVEHAWDEHRRRHGGLIDASMLEPLRIVLDLPSLQAAQQLVADAQNPVYVNQWVEAGAAKAPEEVVKGYLISALLRGVVNHELRYRDGSQYAFHPFRRAILPTGKASGQSLVPYTARWLASMIINGAFDLHDPRERALCWAQNVTRVRLAVTDRDQPLIFDPALIEMQAVTRAVQIVKTLDLTISSRIIGFGVEFFFGLFEALGIFEYIAKLIGWRVPSEAVSDKLTKTSAHLVDLGHQGPGQLVFLTNPISLVPADSPNTPLLPTGSAGG